LTARDAVLISVNLVKRDETTLVTGGGDSKFVFWSDTTVEKQEKARIDAEKRLVEDQNLSNLMHQKLYDRALALALRLERPNTVLKIVQSKYR
jgi:U3 small nucleolar RNA-associated protein 13